MFTSYTYQCGPWGFGHEVCIGADGTNNNLGDLKHLMGETTGSWSPKRGPHCSLCFQIAFGLNIRQAPRVFDTSATTHHHGNHGSAHAVPWDCAGCTQVIFQGFSRCNFHVVVILRNKPYAIIVQGLSTSTEVQKITTAAKEMQRKQSYHQRMESSDPWDDIQGP